MDPEVKEGSHKVVLKVLDHSLLGLENICSHVPSYRQPGARWRLDLTSSGHCRSWPI